MPNWCFNTITIQDHSAEAIDNIKNRLNSPYTRSHENWDMISQQMVTREYTYSNPVFSFWNIIQPTDLKKYVLQKDPDVEEMSFAGDNWYDWNVRNWGTKWDVAVSDEEKYKNTELLEHVSDNEDHCLSYRIDTAWSPPASAIEKLSALYPTAVITMQFEEETGWGGEMEFVNGKLTSQSNYDTKCRDCEAINTLEYCDNDCGEVCIECNYLGEADLDSVKECQDHKIYLDSEHIPTYRKEEHNGYFELSN